jgi:hypothetical protein
MSFLQKLWAELSPQAHRPLDADIELGKQYEDYAVFRYKIAFDGSEQHVVKYVSPPDPQLPQTHVTWELALPSNDGITKSVLELSHQIKSDQVSVILDGHHVQPRRRLNEVGNGSKLTIKHLSYKIDIFIDPSNNGIEYSMKINNTPLRLQYDSIQDTIKES